MDSKGMSETASRTRTKAVLLVLVLGFVVSGCFISSSLLDMGPPRDLAVVKKNVMVEMRDGVRLATDIYKPAFAEKPLPVILTRLPYNKNNLASLGHLFAQHGYIYVVQDCRACFHSEGDVFIPMVYEREDGQDTIEWIKAQPWFNGKLGMWGPSYLGITQWAVADHPAVTCFYPQITTGKLYRAIFNGGAFSYRLATGWSSGVGKQSESASPVPMGKEVDWETEGFYNAPIEPEIELDWTGLRGLSIDQLSERMARAMGIPEGDIPDDFVDRMIELMNYPAFAKNVDAFNFRDYEKIDAPMLMVSGWYDIFTAGQLQDFVAVRERAGEKAASNTKIVIGPWGHVSGVHPDAGKGARLGRMMKEMMVLDWYDRWLKGEDNGIKDRPPIKIYVMGKNVWRDEYEWPLARTEWTSYYLHSNGGANTASGEGLLSTEPPADQPPDRYTYDPRDPVPTMGGSNLLENVGPRDQAEVEARKDVLVYTTPPLEEDLEVTGPIKAVIYAASSAMDTDFTVKLCDVYPDGTSYNIQEGIVRARYRESYREPSLIEPGKIYRYEIDLWDTSNCFLKGHRIRVQVSSSSFPRYDRNTNAGGQGGPMNIMAADQEIYHDGEHPSHLVLPVIP